MSNPFRYFNSSPIVIRLVVIMYVTHPLSLRNVENVALDNDPALGSGLIDHSQKMTVAAMAMADMKVWAHRS